MPHGVAALLVVAAGLLWAGEESTERQEIFALRSAKADFEHNCAACHGLDARGDGPVAEFLIRQPPDLTLLAARNEDRFPEEYAFWIIDGRADVRTHGTREMPVWGDEFNRDSTGLALNPDAVTRINNLVEYLRLLQRQPDD